MGLNCKFAWLTIIVFLLIHFFIGQAMAMDTYLVGPRAMGMAGANVASVHDTTAQYYNPAAFGFFGLGEALGYRSDCDNNNLGRKKWGVDINASGGYRLHNDMGAYLDDLSDIDIDELSEASVKDQSDLADLINLIKDLKGLDDPGNAISADANAGLGIRYGHFALGARTFAQATGRVVEIDTENLSLSGSSDLNAEIENAATSDVDGEISLLTDSQVELLRAAGLSDTAIQNIDYVARQEGITSSEIDGVVDLMADLVDQTVNGSGGDLEDNTTTVHLKGYALAEVPLSYGFALNDHWAVGGNLKLMIARIYGNQIVVFNEDSGEILEQTDEAYEESCNFGIDLGVMGRYRYFNLGVVARNINAPEFDGPTIETSSGESVKFSDLQVDPQITAGVAFIPFETLVLELDCDFLENETTFDDYATQNLSFGIEWDIFRVVALRLGTYKNLAEDDIDWVYTAGIGFNLWAMRIDLAGAFSNDKTEYDGEDIPEETRVSAQLSLDF